MFREALRRPRTTASAGVTRLPRQPQVNPELLDETRLELADFMLDQFGTQTIAEYGFQPQSSEEGAGPQASSHSTP